jgi:SAM-dependent methyltransferase
VLGQLFSVPVAPAATCRVLELGCGDGANLVPMALTLPDASFVGVDLAATAVARGEALVGDLGLTNVELHHGDIESLPAGLGTFDYVIAHGVYSWIPDAAREALLAACRRHLAPGGVAFVSFNAYPGSHLRDMVREMLGFHLQATEGLDDQLRAARALLEAVVGSDIASPWGRALSAHAQSLLAAGEHFVFHDDLGEHHRAFYFHEFAAAAQAHGLQFFSEADFADMELADLPEPVARTLREAGSDPVRLEQYMDFVRARMFRQPLLCRAEVPVDRHIGPGAVRGLAVSMLAAVDRPADLAPGVAVQFRAREGGVLETSEPLYKAALVALDDHRPAAVPFEAMLAAAREYGGGDGGDDDRIRLAQLVLRAYVSKIVDLHAAAPPLASEAGERPVASPLARLQAARGSKLVTSLRHRTITLHDDGARRLVSLLDGSRDREALCAAMGDDATLDRVDDALRHLARLGLLTT